MKNPFYRSIDEKNQSEALLKTSQDEFPGQLPLETQDWSRRDFLKSLGFGSAAVAAACSRMPVEKAIPYLIAEENVVPGKATWYASTCAACPAQCGILVKTREGRPIKIEGNPDAPLNQGGLCAVGQAGVLDLYDSRRLHGPLVDGMPATWDAVDHRVKTVLNDLGEKKIRIRLLTASITSPTLKEMIGRFQKKYPQTRQVIYDAVSVSGLLDAHEIAFGKRVLPHFRFDRAQLILSLNADFLGTWISPVEFTRQYSKTRLPGENRPMSRHIQMESRLSLTGANADERILMKPSQELPTAWALLAGIKGQKFNGASEVDFSALIAQLQSNRGKSLVVSGSNDRNIQLAVLAINESLGNYGRTLDIENPSLQKHGSDADLRNFFQELKQGEIDVVFTLGCNPVYDAIFTNDLLDAFKKTKLVVSLAGRLDETAKCAHVVAPDHHYLESWQDAQPLAGQFHFTQPVIGAIYGTRQAGESLLTWMGSSEKLENVLKAHWNQHWHDALRDGIYLEKNAKQGGPFKFSSKVYEILSAGAEVKGSGDFELQTFESVMLRDGRHAHNPWLQETPDPITKVTWGNVVQMAVADGQRLGLESGDEVCVKSGDLALELPVVLQPGQMNGTLAVALGKNTFAFGNVGFVKVEKTGRHEKLALTQIHYSMEDRPLVKEMKISELDHENSHNPAEHGARMLWQQHESKGHSWGMAIDLNACTGCSGCLVSCQAENNVPVVGKVEVQRQREMHWIRIDRYYKGDLENPDVVFEPMLCQHCANAPCESVCPVLATVHSSEGLNQQVYNRCVGTRYCANNCPYKVRRFNWFDYANNKKFDFHMNDPVGKLVLNPDVTVRSRGVMEKCSLCVQRIQGEKISAKARGEKLNSDEIKTACQQSCPAQAIVFGDRNDPQSKLSQLLNKNPRKFQVLDELNVQPAITYLAKVRNRS